MGRKTFHHLTPNTKVEMQHVRWLANTEEATVVSTHMGEVVENNPRSTRLRVTVPNTVRVDDHPSRSSVIKASDMSSDVSVSKQSGFEWNGDIEWGCWRINPVLAKAKTA